MRHDSLKPGDIFGRLKVCGYSHTSKRKDGRAGERVMDCECACGNKITLKWYAKPVLYFCVFFKLPIPKWVFNIHPVKNG